MKIYIASRFADRKILRPIRDRIWSIGHQVTSTWIDEVGRPEGMSHDEFWIKLARKDLEQIAAADLLIRNLRTLSRTGGADSEFGYALGAHQDKLIWIIGKPRNVFHLLADKQFDTWSQCLKALKEMPHA